MVTNCNVAMSSSMETSASREKIEPSKTDRRRHGERSRVGGEVVGRGKEEGWAAGAARGGERRRGGAAMNELEEREAIMEVTLGFRWRLIGMKIDCWPDRWDRWGAQVRGRVVRGVVDAR
jgi:hypothetical protein